MLEHAPVGRFGFFSSDCEQQLVAVVQNFGVGFAGQKNTGNEIQHFPLIF